MKIVFNALRSGCGLNGGTRTILKSAESLCKIGHEVKIASIVDNFTWFDHEPTINYLPNNFDTIINVAAVDYEVTRKSNIPIKVAFWRAHEVWSNTESHLRYCYSDTKVKNIVNSIGLQQLLSTYGADSKVVYQGMDLDDWKYVGGRSYDKIRIGCLYQKKPTKRWKDFVKLSEILGHEDYEYVGFGDTMREDSFLNKFICLPTHDELVDLYSSCDIWMCPTVLEGLHNIGLEAALCGCLIVCSDAPMNGMIYDYANEETAMIYEDGDIEGAAKLIRNADFSLVPKMQYYIKTNIGTREDNMKKMIDYLRS